MNRSRPLAFVLEYALGHATHADNLKRVIADGDTNVTPVYHDLPYAKDFGAWARLPPFRSNWTLRASLAALQSLRRYRDEPVRAALFHTQITAQLAHGYMAKTPSVVSLDATPAQMDALGSWYAHRAAPAVVEAWKKRVTTKTFNTARKLVTWSQWAKDSLVADYGIVPNKITVIPPGIDTDRWDFKRTPKSANEPLNLLFVGGDFERKGGDTLLEAWRRLPFRVREQARLHLVTKHTPILTASDGVVAIYSDIVPNDARLLDLFARADVFVFPTRADCLPLAVMEALAAGLPVITTNVAALPEAVTDGENGVIVPVSDVSALSAAIEHLCTDAATRERMGNAARNAARDRFDARTNYRKLIETVQGTAI